MPLRPRTPRPTARVRRLSAAVHGPVEGRNREVTKKKRPRGASISFSVDILDTLTPDGVGKRIDATFTNGTGTKKERFDVVTGPPPKRRPAPKK